jgi:hypothetical protein
LVFGKQLRKQLDFRKNNTLSFILKHLQRLF